MAERDREDLGREPIRVNHFAAGRDVAVAMLEEARKLTRTGEALLKAVGRESGAHQHRFVTKYLLQVQRDPRLLDGFTAVLSDYLAGAAVGPEDYRRISVGKVIATPER